MNKGKGGGGEGKLMDRVTKYENQTPFVVLACVSCSLRAHPMIPHPQNQIFVTGAKLGLYLYLSVSKNLINARGGVQRKGRETEKKRSIPYLSCLRMVLVLFAHAL